MSESPVGEEALSLWERAERDVFWRARVRARPKRLESCPHLAFGHPLPEGEDSLEPLHSRLHRSYRHYSDTLLEEEGKKLVLQTSLSALFQHLRHKSCPAGLVTRAKPLTGV